MAEIEKEPLPLEQHASLENRDRSEDASSKEDEKQKEKSGSFGDYLRVFTFASRVDALLFVIGISCAIVVGAALPLMTLIFGSSTSTFNDYGQIQNNPSQFEGNIDHLVLYFVYLFVARFVISYVGTLCICVAGTRTTNNLRKAFLESLLRKDIQHFDAAGNGSAATQVTTSTYASDCVVIGLTGAKMATKLTKALQRSCTTSS